MSAIQQAIASELNVQATQVNAAIALLDDGATVPFIARYRKEATGGLDDTQLRQLAQRVTYLRELDDRRNVILKSIGEQEKLTPELEQAIRSTASKTELEDLYLPYKPKRRTKGQIAREAGIEPLAQGLLADPNLDPDAEATAYINADAGFADGKAVLEGARFILMEAFCESASLLKQVRDYLWHNAHIVSQVAPGKEQDGAKYRDYFEFREALKSIPSHRALALFRGRNEGILQLQLDADPGQEAAQKRSYCEQLIAQAFDITDQGRPADGWLQQTVQWCWRVKLALHMETELMGKVRERAEADAIQVFANNLKDLLMAAPAGARVTMGLDPGVRTGVKVAIVDGTGKVLAHNTLYPFQPQNQMEKSIRTLATLCKQYKVDLISIGNGTYSRETDKVVSDMLKQNPDIKATQVIVNEAGASVYSASELAAQEFPDLDVSIRGAVSIARRLQDPLAELVKIEPKSIGVGQYQHDVSQAQLSQSLEAVVEDCVNAVGVDVNTASVPLLMRVSGLNKTLAQNIVAHRDQHGRFANRKALLEVARMGPKSYEQAAGFLRILDGTHPLDASAVHPEAYPLVERIAKQHAKQLPEIIGDTAFLRSLKPTDFVDDTFGAPTVQDILRELDKPGRDPRPEFKTATFKEGVDTLKDLKPGMTLEGVVSNVANFGAFVDVGVHQDGLVHISSLSDKFISDPREVVKAGDVVKVKVLEVDVARKRISLTMRLNDEVPAATATAKPTATASKPKNKREPRAAAPAPGNTAMGSALADALAKAKKG